MTKRSKTDDLVVLPEELYCKLDFKDAIEYINGLAVVNYWEDEPIVTDCDETVETEKG